MLKFLIVMFLSALSTLALSDVLKCNAKQFSRIIYSVELNRASFPNLNYIKISTPKGWTAEGTPNKWGRGNSNYYLALTDGNGFEFSIAEGDADFALCPKANECYRCYLTEN